VGHLGVAGKIFVVGLSWRTAPVAVREKLAFDANEIAACLDELLRSPSVNEALIISTCNRVEIYGTTGPTTPDDMVESATAEARNFMARSRNISGESLAKTLYERTHTEAVEHVFRVASALDSMVIGESQILGQLKDAYGAAVSANASGPLLSRWMERAFTVAKRVRSETGITRGAANVSSVAVELGRRVFGELAGKTVLIVGAGKMSALAARHLRANGATQVTVTNRSIERARALAEEIEATAQPWDELDRLIAGSDVVISSTGAKEPVLTKKLMKAAMKKRRHKPLVIVDIAVPRDADPSISRLDGVYLFDIDDLERVVAENLKGRSREAEAAGRIVVSEAAEFEVWLRSQKVIPTIRSLREHFQNIANTEAEKVIERLQSQHDEKERDQSIRRLAQLIANKLLHTPMGTLKTSGDPDFLVEATHKLFDLKPADNAEQVAADTESKPVDQTNAADSDKKRGSG